MMFFFDDLYVNYEISRVSAKRMINCNKDRYIENIEQIKQG